MQETKHWAESLEVGDRAIVTIRHETDGSKNIHDATVIVFFNNKRDKNIAASYNDKKILIPYNDITQVVPTSEATHVSVSDAAKTEYKNIADEYARWQFESAFIKGAGWLAVNCFHAECPKCGEKIDVIPPPNTVIKSESTGEWKDKFEEWVAKSWPENNNESAGCHGAARYAMEWMVDNVIKNYLNKRP